jgi:hypothetical protein
MRRAIVMMLAGVGIAVLCAVGYIGLTVWSVGWTKHDGTITVTCPENQKVFCYGY